MRKVAFPVAQLLIVAMGVGAAAAQGPSKEAVARLSDNIETLAVCYAYYADNGNILKSSNKKSEATASYNTAFVFMFLTTSTIIGGFQKKILSLDQSGRLLENAEFAYPQSTSDDRKQFDDVCPNASKLMLGRLDDRMQKFVMTNAKEQAEIYYRSKPPSIGSILEEAKKGLAKKEK